MLSRYFRISVISEIAQIKLKLLLREISLLSFNK